MKYEQRQPAPPADNQIGNRTSTDMAGYSQSDMILPEMHQKADQTTIKPVCIIVHVLANPQLCIRLRCVSYGPQQRSTNKGSQPFLR